MTSCADCPIQHRAVCAKCDTDEFAMLEQMKSYRNFAAGETIVWAGDDLDFVASVVHGCATLIRSLEDGRTQMVGLLMPSDFIGRPGRSRTAYDIVAATDLTMCVFQRAPFEKMLNDSRHISDRLRDMAMDELDAAREWMLLLGRKTAREKVASLLAIILRRGAPDAMFSAHELRPGKTLHAVLPLGREAMADYLGLTIETVSRQMTALRKDGVITMKGTRDVVVTDFAALLTAAGDDGDGAMLA